MANELKIASANRRGLNGKQKRNDVLQYMKEKSFDIICLQDTHFTKSEELLIANQTGFDCFFNSLNSSSRGVAILFRKSFEYTVNNVQSDDTGNLIFLEVTINKQRINLVCLYGPNTDSPDFYENIYKLIEKSDSILTIVCGDFNLIMNKDLDTYNYKNINNPKARDVIIQNNETFNMVDYFRVLNKSDSTS